jgi:Asp-tRNA(Asn)/Glu-tRNA(Gln) amidotransferase A subunit family amidase
LQSFIVSEDVDVETTPTTYGSVTAWAPFVTNSPAAGSAPLVRRALAAGAACTGKAAVQPALQDALGADYGNPHNKARISGRRGREVAVVVVCVAGQVVRRLFS